MSQDANVATWLAWALMAITDSMNPPGGVWFHPGFFMAWTRWRSRCVPPEVFFAQGPPSRPELPGFLGEWPCAALSSEINAGNIRAVLNLGGGLLTAFPDARVLRPALQKLDVLATLEIMHNDVTALSTHLLPTKDQLERADINLWDFLSPRVVAQYSPPVVHPVGERRSSWWVLAELGRRLGYDFVEGLPADDSPASDDLVLARQVGRGRCSSASAETAMSSAPWSFRRSGSRTSSIGPAGGVLRRTAWSSSWSHSASRHRCRSCLGDSRGTSTRS